MTSNQPFSTILYFTKYANLLYGLCVWIHSGWVGVIVGGEGKSWDSRRGLGHTYTVPAPNACAKWLRRCEPTWTHEFGFRSSSSTSSSTRSRRLTTSRNALRAVYGDDVGEINGSPHPSSPMFGGCRYVREGAWMRGCVLRACVGACVDGCVPWSDMSILLAACHRRTRSKTTVARQGWVCEHEGREFFEEHVEVRDL